MAARVPPHRSIPAGDRNFARSLGYDFDDQDHYQNRYEDKTSR